MPELRQKPKRRYRKRKRRRRWRYILVANVGWDDDDRRPNECHEKCREKYRNSDLSYAADSLWLDEGGGESVTFLSVFRRIDHRVRDRERERSYLCRLETVPHRYCLLLVFATFSSPFSWFVKYVRNKCVKDCSKDERFVFKGTKYRSNSLSISSNVLVSYVSFRRFLST